jgi:hypothetical protein
MAPEFRMAKARRAHYRSDQPRRRTFLHERASRCAWCGMLALGTNQSMVRQTELCGACYSILGNVDWERLIGA